MDIGMKISIIETIFTGITSITGTIIAILLYWLSRHQQQETWIKVYEIHDGFWNDPVMTRVRHWINYEQAYLELKPILQKRREIDEGKSTGGELSESEL
jgi:hypothetical protein